MDSVTLVFQGGILLVQSVVCILYGCRTNDKFDELETRINNNDRRIIKLERVNNTRYMPPPASAPPYSSPKSYESYGI